MAERTPRLATVAGLVVAIVVAVAGTAAGGVLAVTYAGPIKALLTPVPPASAVAFPVPGLQKQPQQVLADPSGSGAAPTVAGLASHLGQALHDSRLGPSVSVSIRDGLTGEPLYGAGDSRPAPAASATKLLTAAAALQKLGPDHRFTTRVVQGSEPGSVVLVGGGDPTLGIGPRTAYANAARLDLLAGQVKRALGGAKVSKIVVDTSLFGGPATATGWAPGDLKGDVAPIGALMVDGGRTSPDQDSRPRTATPSTFAATGFAAALGASGATITSGKAPSGARELGSVRSMPLSQIIAIDLEISDNVISEVLGRQVAIAAGLPATFSGMAAAVPKVLAAAGVTAASDARLLDASGLSGADRVTARLLSAVLATASSASKPALRPMLTGLPVAGYTGTLDKRFVSAQARAGAGIVRAKTGTLTGVSSLAGVVVDSSGRLLAFAVVADKVPPTGTLAAEAALDVIGTEIAGCGCS
ncbi:D-alanyl-D-alanine carboxypeptidase/D-alanyl-D-alanine endopeptidase [Fodinicola acaciae]|uniref:D-alanyl-D-alanine carboxypeptidase/D-alanyl-D-alanine endopeptidase n=1 Tax=Fodinicola acaciae TaxID=2681555 RepID=UPI0013D3FE8F|nr:D-alanyl-D-alanine carboxypeptidase/D-alanyl-D-alanine-endopeptidase [Fodinicola acaciae]